MLDLILWIIILIVSLFGLVKASDYFTESAEKIGVAIGISQFIIGVTIVAIGTSLPELVSSIFAVLQKSTEIVAANVVGSNIANILLIFGVAIIINKRLKFSGPINVDLGLLLGSALFILITAIDGTFSKIDAIISIIAAIAYMIYATSPKHKADVPKIKIEKISLKINVVLILSAVFIYLGAKYTIEAVIVLSELIGIGKEVIAISVVALGTSLPELAVTISAARKKNFHMAIGNVLGSNIFNSFTVMGISGIIAPLFIPRQIIYVGIPIMIVSTMIYLILVKKNEIRRWEGILLVLFYLLFIGKTFGLF